VNGFDLLRVALRAPRTAAAELDAFYGTRLGLARIAAGSFRVGTSELHFEDADGAPFYHFALLVPGDRFDAALAWARERVDILTGGDVDDVVFDFDNWNALAFYSHDPAGNIVELIAHHGLGERGVPGPFAAHELLGISEIGLVGDPAKLADALAAIGVPLYDGEVGPGRLAFFGARAKVLIVAPEGRGWLPTGRPSEPHPVDVVVAGARGDASVGAHRIRLR
jgi:D-alanyl-D-alanine carboxypeptidase